MSAVVAHVTRDIINHIQVVRRENQLYYGSTKVFESNGVIVYSRIQLRIISCISEFYSCRINDGWSITHQAYLVLEHVRSGDFLSLCRARSKVSTEYDTRPVVSTLVEQIYVEKSRDVTM